MEPRGTERNDGMKRRVKKTAVERTKNEGERKEWLAWESRGVVRGESGNGAAVTVDGARTRRIGYGISIKQTEIPWEKSHPAPLDWFDVTAHEMNIGPRAHSQPSRSIRRGILTHCCERRMCRMLAFRATGDIPARTSGQTHPETISEIGREDIFVARRATFFPKSAAAAKTMACGTRTKLVSTVFNG